MFYFIAAFTLFQVWFNVHCNKITACCNFPARACNKIKQNIYFIAALFHLFYFIARETTP